MRLAIMHLQSACKGNGLDLSKEDFVDVAGCVPAHTFELYLSDLLSR